MVRAFLFLAALLIASPAVAADWIAVMSYDGDNRITKYQPLGSLAAADAHVAKFIGIYPDAFSAEDPGGSAGEWLVDPIAHTLANSPLPTPVINVLSFDDFESRFTTEEWNEATDFVYAINVETGVPLRRTLLCSMTRLPPLWTRWWLAKLSHRRDQIRFSMRRRVPHDGELEENKLDYRHRLRWYCFGWLDHYRIGQDRYLAAW